MSKENPIPDKLLWVDLEMTGLDPVNDVILEVSAVVTNIDFEPIDSFESVIYHPPEALARINEWSKNQHTKSGLLEKVKTGEDEQLCVKKFTKFIKDNFGDKTVILAGNSIHFDRRFIQNHWPQIDELLHYRMLDVSSWKIVMQSKYSVVFDKKESHRAKDDINESISELKYYLEWLSGHGS